jgi:ribosomal protein L24E
MMKRSSGNKIAWSDKTEIKKILFKNQRQPAEVSWTSSRGHPHTPNSAGGR